MSLYGHHFLFGMVVVVKGQTSGFHNRSYTCKLQESLVIAFGTAHRREISPSNRAGGSSRGNALWMVKTQMLEMIRREAGAHGA